MFAIDCEIKDYGTRTAISPQRNCDIFGGHRDDIRYCPCRHAAAQSRWRIMPLVIVLYLVAYLDWASVGFAKLRMARDLQFSDEVFGLGIGIFFLGYLTLENSRCAPGRTMERAQVVRPDSHHLAVPEAERSGYKPLHCG